MAYTPTDYQDEPSTATPVSAANLRKTEQGLAAAAGIADTALAVANASPANGAVTAAKLSPAVGSNGQVLTLIGGQLVWAAPTGSAPVTVDRNKYVANQTLGLVDAGRIVDVESASAVTLTVPSTGSVAWQDGTVIQPVALGDGIVSIAPGAGVSFIPSGTWKLRAKGSPASLRKLPGGSAVLPTVGLLMRYRADDLSGANGSAVASWPESSGNSLPAAVQATTGAQPTLVTNAIGSHKAVAFNGAGQFLQLTGSALALAQNRGALGLFIVYNYGTAVTGTRTLFALASGASATSVRCLLQQRDSTGVIGGGGRRLDANTGQFVSGVASVAGNSEVAAAAFDWVNSDLLIYKDGTQVAANTSFQTAGNSENTVSLAGTIGANLAGTAEFCNVRIAEILAYNAVDATLRANIATYIQATYGIAMADSTSGGDVWHIAGDITL